MELRYLLNELGTVSAAEPITGATLYDCVRAAIYKKEEADYGLLAAKPKPDYEVLEKPKPSDEMYAKEMAKEEAERKKKKVAYSEFREGDAVTYVSPATGPKIGIVKEVHNNASCFVVYNCNNDWKNYKDYTGQATAVSSLVKGWIKYRESV